jgi:hypothetical protein
MLEILERLERWEPRRAARSPAPEPGPHRGPHAVPTNPRSQGGATSVNTLTRRAAGVSAIIGVVLAAGSVAANAAGRLVIGDGSGNRTVTATGNTTINAPSNLCANPVDASAVCDNDQDDVSAGLGAAPDGPVVGTGSGNLDQTVLGNTSTHTPLNTCGNPVSAVDQEPPAEPPAPATAQVASGQAAELNGAADRTANGVQEQPARPVGQRGPRRRRLRRLAVQRPACPRRHRGRSGPRNYPSAPYP